MTPIIEVNNLGKKYDITHMRGGYVALRDVLSTVARRPFSFLKHKAKQAIGLEKKEEFWALKQASFTVNKGEVLGIIGKNGAGKSTLLKILSQITPPTEGEVTLHGRIGSLLEVGTGFHPELTGRENIFLNGAILGMKKGEIAQKFDKIVAFAGVERFLDTPVKHYSSGMYVRLAFSVAAHMEPDILLIDEVLAVGDVEFQKKCLGKMDEITKKDGRTIIFVSHNLEAIRELCGRTIVLDQGRIAFDGPTPEALDLYLDTIRKRVQKRSPKKTITDAGEFSVIDAWIESKGQRTDIVAAGDDMDIIVEFTSNVRQNDSTRFAFALYDTHTDHQLSDLWTNNLSEIAPARGRVVCSIPRLPLNTGTYGLNLCIRTNGFVSLLMKEVLEFDVVFGDFFGTGKLPDKVQGPVLIDQNWRLVSGE